MILKFNSVIILSVLEIVLGQSCKLSSGKNGYCREKEDCFGPYEENSCQNDLFCCQNSEKSIMSNKFCLVLSNGFRNLHPRNNLIEKLYSPFELYLFKECKDYGKYVYNRAFNGALTARAFVHNVSECKIEAIPLVVGGLKAEAKEFPHMAAIGYGNDIKTAKWMCGGSLISENFVLTAAHCSKSEGGGLAKFVRMGTLNLNSPDDSNCQDFTIAKIINHPKYNAPSRYNDIALYKLSGSVEINGFVRPACLQTNSDEFSFKKGMATGWGKLHYNANEGSEDLMKVVLNFIDYSQCNSSYSSDIGGSSLKKGIISSQICAGELQGGKDTCQGDSGGPLQIGKDDPYCMYSIVGITSFGKFCGFKNSPAVYTRVSYFVPWIESIVWR